jgi:hypothetical protein
MVIHRFEDSDDFVDVRFCDHPVHDDLIDYVIELNSNEKMVIVSLSLLACLMKTYLVRIEDKVKFADILEALVEYLDQDLDQV